MTTQEYKKKLRNEIFERRIALRDLECGGVRVTAREFQLMPSAVQNIVMRIIPRYLKGE